MLTKLAKYVFLVLLMAVYTANSEIIIPINEAGYATSETPYSWSSGETVVIDAPESVNTVIFDADQLGFNQIKVFPAVNILIRDDILIEFRSVWLDAQGGEIEEEYIQWRADLEYCEYWKGIVFTGEVPLSIISGSQQEETIWGLHGMKIIDVDVNENIALDLKCEVNSGIDLSPNDSEFQNLLLSSIIIEGNENIPLVDRADAIYVNTYQIKVDFDDIEIKFMRDAVNISTTCVESSENSVFELDNLDITGCRSGIIYQQRADGETHNNAVNYLVLRNSLFSHLNNAIVFEENISTGFIDIHNTNIDNCDSDGIKIAGTDFTTRLHQGTTIKSCFNGIHIGGDRNDIISESTVDIHSNLNDGINVTGDSFYFLVLPNNGGVLQAFNNQRHGAYLESNDLHVELASATFDTNIVDGIHLESNHFNLYMSYVHAADNENNGLFVANNSQLLPANYEELPRFVAMESCELSDNSANGMEVTCLPHGSSLMDGVLIYAGGTNSQNPMKFERNSSHGAYIHDLNCVNGLFYFGVNQTFTNDKVSISIDGPCHFNENGNDGLFVQGNRNSVISRDCEYSRNYRDGIHIMKEVEDAIVSEFFGVRFSDTGSTINANHRNGIYSQRNDSYTLGENYYDFNSINLLSSSVTQNSINYGARTTSYRAGIFLEDYGNQIGHDHEFNSCFINDNGDQESSHQVSGIYINTDSQRTIVNSCNLASNKNEGISSAENSINNRLKVYRSHILENGTDGIEIISDNVWEALLLKQNKLFNNTNDEILIGTSFTVYDTILWNVIEKEVISNALGSKKGIVIKDDGEVLVQNNIIRGHKKGIRITSNESSTLINNIIDIDNGVALDIAIEAELEAEEITIRHNTFVKTSEDGTNTQPCVVINSPLNISLDHNVIVSSEGSYCIRSLSGTTVVTNSVCYNHGGENAFLGNVQFVDDVIIADPKLYPYDESSDNIFLHEKLFRYHLMWDSPAININQEWSMPTTHHDPPAKTSIDSELWGINAPDAGAFGGILARHWPIPPAGPPSWFDGQPPRISDLFNYEIYYKDWCITPVESDPGTFPEPGQVIVTDVGAIKPDVYFVTNDLLIHSTSPVNIPDESYTDGACSFLVGFKMTGGQDIAEPASISINRNVNFVNNPYYSAVIDTVLYPWELWNLDYNIGFLTEVWEGIVIEDFPVDGVHNLERFMVRNAKTGITCKSNGTIGESIIVEQCSVGVRLEPSEPEPHQPYAATSLTLNNSRFVDISDTCVALGHGYPHFTSDNSSYGLMTGSIQCENGIMMSAGAQNDEDRRIDSLGVVHNDGGSFDSNNSVYSNFSEKAISLKNVSVRSDFDQISNVGLTGFTVVIHAQARPIDITNSEISNCGTSFALPTSSGFNSHFAGIVLYGCDYADVYNNTITDCYGPAMAIHNMDGAYSIPFVCQNTFESDFLADIERIRYFYLSHYDRDNNPVYGSRSRESLFYIGENVEFFIPWYNTFIGPTYDASTQNPPYWLIQTGFLWADDAVLDFKYCTWNSSDTITEVVHGNSETRYLYWPGYVGSGIPTHPIQRITFDFSHTETTNAIPGNDKNYTRNSRSSINRDLYADQLEFDPARGATFINVRNEIADLIEEKGYDSGLTLLESHIKDYPDTKLAHKLTYFAPQLFIIDGAANAYSKAYQEYDQLAKAAKENEDYVYCEIQKLFMEPEVAKEDMNFAYRTAEERWDDYLLLLNTLENHKIAKRSGETDFLPEQFKLHAPYPNPFNSSVRIKFDVPATSDVKIRLYNINGQAVETLQKGYLNAGEHMIQFNGKSLASGVYFVRMEAEGFEVMKKIILMK